MVLICIPLVGWTHRDFLLQARYLVLLSVRTAQVLGRMKQDSADTRSPLSVSYIPAGVVPGPGHDTVPEAFLVLCRAGRCRVWGAAVTALTMKLTCAGCDVLHVSVPKCSYSFQAVNSFRIKLLIPKHLQSFLALW